MSEWDQFEDAEDEQPQGESWEGFESVDQTEVVRQPDPPPITKSEQTSRDLSFIDLKAGFGTVAKFGYDMAREATAGVAGMAGVASAAIPGGDKPSERGPRWVEGVRNFLPEWHPKDEGIQLGMEMAGKGMGRVVEEVKKTGSPAAYAGARMAGASPEEASLSMQDFVEQENALGEGTFQVTGSPTAAVVAQMLPEAAAALVPPSRAKPVRPAPRNMAPEMPPSGFGGVGPVDDAVTAARAAPEAPPMDAFDRLRDAVRRGDKEALLAEVNANPAIVAAFDELGIEFTPSMVSENAALRQVEAGLASKADSGLSQAYELAEFKLNQSARELIDDAGGSSTSPASVAQDIEVRYNEIHGNMAKREGEIWTDLETKVPRGAEVNARVPAARIYREAELAGGGDIELGLRSLRQHERRLFEMTHRRVVDPETEIVSFEYREPTYAAVNRFREDLGNSMQTGKPFGDANSGMLDQMYGEMAHIQGRVAKAEGYGDDWTRANELTQTRKELEAAMQRTMGRGLNQSVVTRVNGAMSALLKGDVKKWDQLFDDLPTETRAAAAAQALDQVFFTAGKNTKMSQSWINNFEKIKRDPQLRDRIFDQLPMDARSEFMRLGEAATGFYRAMEKLNRSNTANAMTVIDMIERPGFMNRILGGTLERSTGRLPVLGEWIRTITARTPEAKKAGGTERIKVGADLLMDPSMHRAIIEYAAGNVELANQILKDSQSWARWAKTQPIPAQERLMSAGIVALFEEETE